MKIDMRRYAAHQPGEQAAVMLTELLPIVANIDVLRNRVLVATYQQPDRTSGGIILVDDTLNEGKWQGKCGLVLKVGPVAFGFDEVLEDANNNGAQAAYAHHNIPNVGDWVFFRGSDTWDCGIAVMPGTGVHCRFINDDSIVGRVTDPSIIY
jgi:hypothetical protein